MSQPQPFASEPDPTAPFRSAFNALIGFGRDLLGRVQAAIVHQSTAHLPRRLARNPLAAEQRLIRTLDWIVALARTLAGDRTWLVPVSYAAPRFPGRYPSLTAQLRAEIGLPPVPLATAAQKAAAHRRYVQKVFATQPTARIAARLARRLGIANTSDFWPHELLTITQTPAAFAAAARPRPAGPCAPPPPTNAPASTATSAPTATPNAPPPPLATGPP